MKTLAQKYFLPLLFFGLAFFLFPSLTFAAAQDLGNFGLEEYNQARRARIEETKKSDGKTLIEVSGANRLHFNTTLLNLTDSILCLDEEPYCNPEQTATGFLSKTIAMLYSHPPASAMAYTYDLFYNLGFLAKPAYAQGIGFAGLSPLLPLWKATRNISYVILIIVLVAIGFMIIFRMKIDPKTVISVQAALPKIVITLLLITFSYPIAGFFIDLMYLSIFLLINIIGEAVKNIPNDQIGLGAHFIKDTALQQQEFISGGMWKLVVSVFSAGLVPATFQQLFAGSVPAMFTGLIGEAGLGALIFKIMTTGLFSVVWIKGLFAILAFSLLILLIIGLGLLFTLIRLTFLLLNSYIQLLIAVIIGPLLLLQEAIPGRSAFGAWIQNIIANLVVFPATIGVIYLSWIFTAILWKGKLWIAPLLPYGGGGTETGNPLSVFIGLGIIFMAPSLVAQVKKAFHPKPTLPVTAGTAFSPVTGGVSGLMNIAQSFYYGKAALGSIPGLNKIFKHEH